MLNTRKKEIRIKADDFRNQCRIAGYGIADLFKDCERSSLKIIRYPHTNETLLGFVTKRDDDIVIFTNSSSRRSREIFTLAHEIGHVVLHFNESESFEDTSMTLSDMNPETVEQEANYFAACLLMPDDEVRKFLDLEIDDFQGKRLSAMDIARIMSEFNVSFEMALNRLESLGFIDEIEKAQLDNDKNEARVGNLLRSVGGNAQLNEPSRVIDIPREYLEYTIYNYNRNAIPKETLNRLLKYYRLSMDDIQDQITREEENEVDDDLDALIGG